VAEPVDDRSGVGGHSLATIVVIAGLRKVGPSWSGMLIAIGAASRARCSGCG
jgi:hypothetical protein